MYNFVLFMIPHTLVCSQWVDPFREGPHVLWYDLKTDVTASDICSHGGDEDVLPRLIVEEEDRVFVPAIELSFK
jgi:hypothetical protein